MNRKKRLTLATAAVMALTMLIGATSASAATFESGGVETEWRGSLVSTQTQLRTNYATLSCNQKEAVKIQGTASYRTLSVAAPPMSCGGWLGLPVNWSRPGCELEFKTGAAESMVGTVSIVGCEPHMQTSLWGPCTITIPNQEAVGSVSYTNEGSGSTKTVRMGVGLKGLTYTEEGAGCVGKKQTLSNGEYEGVWSLAGFSSGSQVPVWVEPTLPPPLKNFTVQETPATVVGHDDQTAGLYLAPVGSLNCQDYTLEGSASSTAFSSVALSADYEDCTFGGWELPDSAVDMGGCGYVFHVNGTLDIAGEACASDPITIEGGPEWWPCLLTIGPQAGLSGLSYVEGTEEGLKYVTVKGQATGMEFTAAGSGYIERGTFDTGAWGLKLKRTTTLQAETPLGEQMHMGLEPMWQE